MSKIVTKFRYYKPKSREKKGGYAKYIATRDGVEKINNTPPNSPTTLSQQALIKQLFLDFPDSVEMLEYADYLADPTVSKASEFITRAIEDNAQEVVNRTTYADYIATRPRAERLGNQNTVFLLITILVVSKSFFNSGVDFLYRHFLHVFFGEDLRHRRMQRHLSLFSKIPKWCM